MENNNCRFSVIVPIHNGEKYIDKCIRSVEEQEYSSYEIVIVDDGSSDNSAGIVAEYEKRNNRIKLITQNNSGPYNARINGIINSKGEFLLFLDCDDEFQKDTFNRLEKCIQCHQADLIFFNMSKDKNCQIPWLKYPFKSETVFKSDEKQELYKMACTSNLLNNLATKCIKRTLFHAEEFERHDFFLNGEDLFTFMPILERAETIVYLSDNFYYYRQHELSTMHTYNPYYFSSLTLIHKRCIEYAKKWCGDTAERRARQFASGMCISAVKHEVKWNKEKRQRENNILKILTSDIYKENRLYKPENVGKKGILLYYIFRLPISIDNKTRFAEWLFRG